MSAKVGLDYYSMDVGFLRDKKVKLLRAEFGASSVVFVLYVLGKVYEGDGYFLRWDKDECLITADELRESPNYISEVLQGCLSRSLFDERVFQMFGVLTSAGIQRRYLRGCAKRDVIEIYREYWLLNVDNKKDVPASILNKVAFLDTSGGKNSINSPGNTVNSSESPQSKVKKSKVEESKTVVAANKLVSSAPTHEPPLLSPEEIQARKNKYGGAYEKWERTIARLLTPTELDTIPQYVDKYGEQWVIDAMQLAAVSGKCNLRYVEGILKSWLSEGRDTPCRGRDTKKPTAKRGDDMTIEELKATFM